MKLDIYIEDSYGDRANVYVDDNLNTDVKLSANTDLLAFTPDQARELAQALIKAADVAEE